MSESLLVVVLSGKSKRISDEHGKLRCVQASLVLPGKLGDTFSLCINHCIPFNERTYIWFVSDESYNQEAIALYLNAMTVGIEHALAITTTGPVYPPRSLCFTKLRKDLRLIGSPIPFCNETDQEVKISQGEIVP
jgi:hypothetical protein